jgi:hypothetical protein
LHFSEVKKIAEFTRKYHDGSGLIWKVICAARVLPAPAFSPSPGIAHPGHFLGLHPE